jgi:nitroreductase
MDVLDAIASRRSIKPQHMKPDPIERTTLRSILEAANWAPTHGMTEPWRFIVFTGEARKALVEAVLETMVEPGEALPVPPADPRRAGLDKMLVPPVILAIICQPSTNPKIVEDEELISTGIAVQNIHLAARAHGIAGYWTSGKKAFHPRMATFLGLSPPARCLGFFYLGYPAGPWPEGRRGTPIDDKLSWRE